MLIRKRTVHMRVYYHMSADITVECLGWSKSTRYQVLTSTESGHFIDILQ
jgi:hypothetical protein